MSSILTGKIKFLAESLENHALRDETEQSYSEKLISKRSFNQSFHSSKELLQRLDEIYYLSLKTWCALISTQIISPLDHFTPCSFQSTFISRHTVIIQKRLALFNNITTKL